MRLKLFICLLLFGITLAVYWPARHFDLIYYDDPLFVTDNSTVTNGLSAESFKWAMTSVVAANWAPLTHLSFVLTHQFFGINPGAEHLVNAFFHAANAVLLFLALAQLFKTAPGNARPTGNVWRCAIVAAIFAWHPLRVESVAWITERKDVLFAFFEFIAIFAYGKFVEGKNEKLPRGWIWYLAALIAFALGFMSKAMIVTLPFLLLLLDFWPLRRFNNLPIQRLLLEKIPFFALTIFFSALTFWIQQTHAAVVPLEKLGIFERIENATLAYAGYPGKFFWPAKLAAIYPFPRNIDFNLFVLAAILLLAISALCIWKLRRMPYLAVGWFWFLGTFVPVIGLVQIGETAMADRYTYLPLIGISIALVWLVARGGRSSTTPQITGLAELDPPKFPVNNSLLRKSFLAVATACILAALIILTSRQLQFWRNTVSLFEHTIAVTRENPSAEFCLASGFEHENRLNDAAAHYRIATEIAPDDFQARYNLAICLDKLGDYSGALAEDEPLLASGYKRDDFAAHANFADVFMHSGRYDEAVSQLETALRLNPDSTEVLNNFAWLLATCPDAKIRDGKRAVELAERACKLSDDKQTVCIGTLAAAYAEANEFDDAIATAQRAIARAQANGETDLAQRNRQLLKIYQAHKPFREKPSGGSSSARP
ncbi:MAG TPA: tetratricopeptide repeat protein [Verrucomicrobiae bacterium]|nr:tetratricopeptide repeat protein [Verrucomicrobiae bacterium]